MSSVKQRAQEDELAREALRIGPQSDRRRFFVTAAAFGAAAAAPELAFAQAAAVPAAVAASAPAAPARRAIVKDDSRVLNIGATVRTGQYWNYSTFITPTEEFFVRNHYPTPTVEQRAELDPKRWKMKIHGNAVERPIEIGYEDLLKMPFKTVIATMECHGNGRTLFWEQQGMMEVAGGNWLLGAVGQAEWQIVPISHILGLIGLKRDAKSALFWSGMDGPDIGRPIPVSELLARGDDIGICYKMNGSPLLADHGAPVRLVVPGWGGTSSIKWLTEMRVDNHNHWTRVNTKGEAYIGPSFQAPAVMPNDEFMPNITAADVKGPMVTWMPIKSMITVPLVLERSPSVPANYPLKRGELPIMSAGRQMLRGYAWAPQHGIKLVDVRIDGGPWRPTQIRQPNLGRYTWVRFELPWDATPGDHVIETRGMDTAFNMQPESVPLNTLGMANHAIPKFRIRVV